MALSQKHAGKMLVPWFNSMEWKHVNHLIFATNSTDVEKTQALEILQMWKIRTPKLPSGVEGTLIILDALLQKKDFVSEDKLRILHGASIMRFLNLCGAITDKQGTLYRKAKRNKLPDWLVDLRHDIAHDQIIPSKFMLHMGLEFCFNWLKREYWEKQNTIIKDFIIDIDPKKNIKSMFGLYCQINLAQYSGNVKDIQDIAHQNPSIIEKLNELEIIEIDADTNVDIKCILDFLLENMDDEDYQNLEDIICDIIVTDGSIFATKVNQCENGKEELPRDFAVIWQDLINFLYKKNMFVSLLKNLLNLKNVETMDHDQTKKIASLWLAELCKSLLLTEKIYNQYNNLSNIDKLNKDTAGIVLKQLTQKENPELRGCLELDFQYYKDIIDPINCLRLSVLQNPHIFTLNFLKYFLQVCGCTEEYIHQTESLINAYLFPQNNTFELNGQLHTLEECQKIVNNTNISNMDMVNLEDNPISEVTLNNSVTQAETTPGTAPQKRWKIVKDTSIFEGCPLGVLSYQIRDTNPLLLQELL